MRITQEVKNILDWSESDKGPKAEALTMLSRIIDISQGKA